MKQIKANTYNRQDAVMTRFTLGMLFSPLFVLLTLASAISF